MPCMPTLTLWAQWFCKRTKKCSRGYRKVSHCISRKTFRRGSYSADFYLVSLWAWWSTISLQSWAPAWQRRYRFSDSWPIITLPVAGSYSSHRSFAFFNIYWAFAMGGIDLSVDLCRAGNRYQISFAAHYRIWLHGALSSQLHRRNQCFICATLWFCRLW